MQQRLDGRKIEGTMSDEIKVETKTVYKIKSAINSHFDEGFLGDDLGLQWHVIMYKDEEPIGVVNILQRKNKQIDSSTTLHRMHIGMLSGIAKLPSITNDERERLIERVVSRCRYDINVLDALEKYSFEESYAIKTNIERI